MRNKILTAVFILSLVLLLLTVSIGLPIYCRFFYYLQIKPLDIEGTSDLTYEQIRTAYDEMLDYLTLAWASFGVGELAYSPEGAAHFADCKVLFNLNLSIMIVSGAVVLLLSVLHLCKKIRICRPFGRSAGLLSAIIAVAVPVVIGLLALIAGFDKAFTAFHKIFFPGKDNWVFDWRVDQIITILPQEFFLNCAIFIGSGLLAFCTAIIVYDVVSCRKRKKKLENKGE